MNFQGEKKRKLHTSNFKETIKNLDDKKATLEKLHRSLTSKMMFL